MKLITIKSQILSVKERWLDQYPKKYYKNAKKTTDSRKWDIYCDLLKLDLKKATAKDVSDIIGNDSWACKQECTECEKHFSVLVQLGQKPDYDSSTIQLCKSCLKKALKLAE